MPTNNIGTAILRAWMLSALAMTAVSLLMAASGDNDHLTLRYLGQDLPVLVVTAAALILIRDFARRGPLLTAPNPGWAIPALCVLVALIGVIGKLLVFHGYSLSLDEFMATFDARILARGHLVAPVPAAFRELVPAMEPAYRTPVAGYAGWVSTYLPGNAALLALPGGLFWVPPFLAGLAVALIWGIGRRLAPDRPSTALIAAALLASAPQLLVTAMTPYAMTAHLALNLLWLWLVLRNRPWSHLAAAVVAFWATGLHQLAFHPMFAAPFVLSMWRDRRWQVASFHSLAYLAILLFWINWWPFALGTEGLVTVAAGPGLTFATAHKLAATFKLENFGLMAQNLLRFMAWQNPLTVALFILGVRQSWQSGGVRRDLLIGIMLPLVMVTVLMPTQGYGQGYRYLHGSMGNFALLAALAWANRTGGQPAERDNGGPLIAAVVALSFLVLLPIHAWQAHRMAAPFAHASNSMAKADADYVLLDRGALADDLVRNDPWLTNRPKLLALAALDGDQLTRICANGRVAIFGTPESIALDLPRLVSVRPAIARNRQLLATLHCDRQRVTLLP